MKILTESRFALVAAILSTLFCCVKSPLPADENPTLMPASERESLDERLEIASVRLAIRSQAVVVAKTERKLLGPNAGTSFKEVMDLEAKADAAEEQFTVAEKLRSEKLISDEEFFAKKQNLRSVRAKLDAFKTNLGSSGLQLAVKDEEIKLLELRVVLAETRLKQLRRRLRAK